MAPALRGKGICGKGRMAHKCETIDDLLELMEEEEEEQEKGPPRDRATTTAAEAAVKEAVKMQGKAHEANARVEKLLAEAEALGFSTAKSPAMEREEEESDEGVDAASALLARMSSKLEDLEERTAALDA